MDKQYDSLKVEYSIASESADDRLIPVDILVMHDGVNYNSSSFSKEAMELAKETLKNVPILAYIKENDQGDKDFSGHEMEVSLQENKDGDLEFKVKYLERPIGVIPETNDYHYEERDGKTYVSCRGYLWKEYLNDGLEILQDNPSKSVSMEISVTDGAWNDEINAYDITNYKYIGVTVLGDDVAPAMQGSKMDVASFSVDNKDFFAKVEKLNKELKQSAFEGGESVGEKFEEEVVETTEETFEETTEDVEETTVDASEEVSKTEETTEEFTDEEVTETTEIEDVESKEVVETETEVEEDFEVEETPSLEDYNQLLNDYEILKAENEELKSFKADILSQQRTNEVEEVFDKYSTLLDVSDYEDLKESAMNMEIDELEKELSFRLVQKKFDFSKITKKDSTKITIKEDKDAKEPYGSASIYFNK